MSRSSRFELSRRKWLAFVSSSLVGPAIGHSVTADDAPRKARLYDQLEPYFKPPAEFANMFGDYPSPLEFDDGTAVKSAADWPLRRKEILATWHRRLGVWPTLVEKPKVVRLESTERDDIAQFHVQVQVSPDGKVADGYLLVPPDTGG